MLGSAGTAIIPSIAGGQGLRNETYIKLHHAQRVWLMECCNKAAICCRKLGDFQEVWSTLKLILARSNGSHIKALIWLTEVYDVLYLNIRYTKGTPVFGSV
jgi:hypothetical protein